MASPSIELQKMIYDRLIADPDVSQFVADRVYDGPPPGAEFPYVSFGPSDFTPDDAECIVGREETIQLDVWSNDSGRLNPCKEIADTVKASLHEFAGALTVHALVSLRVTSVRVFLDPDGITAHGVLTVTALVEEN